MEENIPFTEYMYSLEGKESIQIRLLQIHTIYSVKDLLDFTKYGYDKLIDKKVFLKTYLKKDKEKVLLSYILENIINEKEDKGLFWRSYNVMAYLIEQIEKTVEISSVRRFEKENKLMYQNIIELFSQKLDQTNNTLWGLVHMGTEN